MKFTVLRENLLKGLQVVLKAVSVRSPLPVLSNVLIKAEKGQLRLTTSDLQITVIAEIGAKVDKQGEITVPAKLLMEFVNQVGSEKIEAGLDGSVLKLQTAKAMASFAGTPASEFPEVVALKGGIEIVLASEDLVDAVQKVQFAVATDEGRPVLTGVYFKISNNELILAGTDGFRMAEYRLKLGKSVGSNIECVLPARSLTDLIRSFASESDKITLLVDAEKNVVVIKVDDMEAHLRMIEGEYPDYAAVVPTEFTTEVFIGKEELLSGVKLASIFSRDLGNVVKFIASKSGIEALSQPTEAGSNSTKMKGKLDGDEIEIAFNAKYLLDLLSNINEDEIIFRATEPVKPGLFRIQGKDNYFYLVMPMKATW